MTNRGSSTPYFTVCFFCLYMADETVSEFWHLCWTSPPRRWRRHSRGPTTKKFTWCRTPCKQWRRAAVVEAENQSWEARTWTTKCRSLRMRASKPTPWSKYDHLNGDNDVQTHLIPVSSFSFCLYVNCLVPPCSRKRPKPPRSQRRRRKILARARAKAKAKARGQARPRNDRWLEEEKKQLPPSAPTHCYIFLCTFNDPLKSIRK